MSTKVTEVVTNTADTSTAVKDAFSIENGTAVRIGVKDGSRTMFVYSITRFDNGWSVRDGRKVVARKLERAVVRKRIERKVARMIADGVKPENLVVLGHRREPVEA